MVVVTGNYCPSYHRYSYYTCSDFCICALYLYFVLIILFNMNKRIKSLETIIALSIVSLVLYYICRQNNIFIIITLSLLLTGLFYKKGTEVISAFWEKFSLFIGNLNNKVLLGIIFFAILTPISLIYRVFHNNQLIAKKNDSLTTYYNERKYKPAKNDFENMF